MKIFAETPRLILREILPEDETGMFEMDSNPEVHKYLGNKPYQSIEQSRENIRFIRQQYADYGIGRWAVVEKESGKFMGWSGLKFMTSLNGHNNFHDIGYRFIPKFWGQGFATEAAIVARDYAFQEMKLPIIYGTTHIQNLTSKYILEKIGLQFIETFPYEDLTCNWLELERNDWHKL
jgi:RimJ/RimL family protein N-acetyltransferase